MVKYLIVFSFQEMSFVTEFLKDVRSRSGPEIALFSQRVRAFAVKLSDYDKRTSRYARSSISFLSSTDVLNFYRKWYLHLLVMHVPQLLKREKSIVKFSCSAQERMNGLHSSAVRCFQDLTRTATTMRLTFTHILQIDGAVQKNDVSHQLLKREQVLIYSEFVDRTCALPTRKYKAARKKAPVRHSVGRQESVDVLSGVRAKKAESKKRRLVALR